MAIYSLTAPGKSRLKEMSTSACLESFVDQDSSSLCQCNCVCVCVCQTCRHQFCDDAEFVRAVKLSKANVAHNAACNYSTIQ